MFYKIGVLKNLAKFTGNTWARVYFLNQVPSGVRFPQILMTVCSCHVTYAFQSESTLFSCLNLKGFLARSRREI